MSADAFFASAGAVPVLEPAEVIRLARVVQAWQAAEGGPDAAPAPAKRAGIAARNRLVAHNLRLVVRAWVRSFSVRLPSAHRDLGDALQMGAMGLVRAAEKFDPEQGRTFATYADAWIRKGFQDYFKAATAIRVPCDFVPALKAAARLFSAAEVTRQPLPSWEEVRAALLADGFRSGAVPSVAAFPNIYGGWVASCGVLSLDSPSNVHSDGQTLGDLIVAPAPAEPSLLDTVHANLCRLDATQRRVLEMTYRGALNRQHGEQSPSPRPFTIQQIARTVGVKPSQLPAIRTEALANLRGIVEAVG
jgi:RNA polymerase sigma factor (sigma-70 family)